MCPLLLLRRSTGAFGVVGFGFVILAGVIDWSACNISLLAHCFALLY